MRGRPSELLRRRRAFQQQIDEIGVLVDDFVLLAEGSGPWAGARWKVFLGFEMLAVRSYTLWEELTHDVLILSLAMDTSELAKSTGLRLRPVRVSADMAEAILTARGYLEFRDIERLKGDARRWLVASPFDALTKADSAAADELRTLRNYIVHRSRQSAQAYEKLLMKNAVPLPLPTPGEFLARGTPPRLRGHALALSAAAQRLVP